MKTLLNLCLTVLLFGCVSPLSETDPELYRQYKYWEAGVNDWHPARGFDVRANRFLNGGWYGLRLTPHRENAPSFASGYIEAAEQVAFEMMTAQCGAQNFVAQAAPQDAGLRTLDRYFYQNADLSIGIRFRCRKEAEKPI